MHMSLVAESATWFSFTLVVLFTRIISRSLLSGSTRKFQADDILIAVALTTDTVLLVCINILSFTSTNLFDPKNPPALTPQDIGERVFGSKLTLVVEQMQIATTWLVKACLIIMYSRLAFSAKQKLAVKIVAGYVALGFVVMELLYFTAWCRPFRMYWAVPTNSIQCSAAINHLITNAVFNITSDICIILIPMPALYKSSLPLPKKIMLSSVFALALFTIGAAIANKYYSFSEPFGSDWVFWYIRESSTALIVANLPYAWALVRITFKLKSFHSETIDDSSDKHSPNLVAKGLRVEYGHNHRGIKHKTTISRGSTGPHDFGPLDSQEHINNAFFSGAVPLKIYKRQEVHITHEFEEPGWDDPASDPASKVSIYTPRPSTHRPSRELKTSFSI